ncbi:L-lysine exporter family protein LysE/ArgO [Lentibacillus halodurans]|uniref:L-lysine exporter family protein LysE/ArgO n=1 Tax=Lentibacillus halodurans TaxID=237679 RepID=A0A1I0ZU54_9BACI|nr:LysE/ArgO family amino acid transporter [Lentibacillus halodurans]SFB29057.1 L-lysine exporter family protein LysE/ArgO [Lentibacillus halodurans]
MEALLHGVMLAFGLILPLGVQNIFVFNQGATHLKFINVLPVIMAAGFSDTLLIYLAVAGVSFIVFNFEWLTVLLFIGGFFFLVYMGWVMWKSQSEQSGKQQSNKLSAKRQVTFAVSVSLLNPHAIMDTIGIIGTSSLVYTGYEKWLFTAACIGVSWVWFLTLAVAGRKLGQLDKNGQLLKRMNQASAIIIWGMAMYMGYQLFSR